MSSSYSTTNQAIYDYINAINVTSVYPAGWKRTANYLIKQLDNSQYPAFFVTPAEDDNEGLDTYSDETKLSFYVYFIDTFEDASDAEDRLRRLADLIRTEVRKIRFNPSLLSTSCRNVEIKGSWGAQVEQGERFYRLQLDVFLYEPLV